MWQFLVRNGLSAGEPQVWQDQAGSRGSFRRRYLRNRSDFLSGGKGGHDRHLAAALDEAADDVRHVPRLLREGDGLAVIHRVEREQLDGVLGVSLVWKDLHCTIDKRGRKSGKAARDTRRTKSSTKIIRTISK